MMKFTVLAITIYCLASTAHAQSHFIGNDWNRWSDGEKIMYLNGWVDGRQQGLWDAVVEFKPELLKTWNNSDSRVSKLSYGRITVGQVLAGVNKLYGDYRNLHIELASIVPNVLDDASGRRPLTEGYL